MVVVEGSSVRLRPISPAERPTIRTWYLDPELVAPFDRYAVETDEEFARSLDTAEGDPASLAPRFGIERRAQGDLVGVVGYYAPHPVLEFLDLWYVIGVPAARGHGLGREAVELLVDHLFRTESFERIGATCDVENAPSYRLLEGIGFRREGTLRSALFHHGRWHDVHVYGVTRAERAPRPARG
jgi:[ribosomal protein S5]-alanine N-acetyltransferase